MASLALSACGSRDSEAMRSYVLQDGDWGWDNGAGCDGQADIWRFDGDNIEMYRDGTLVDRGIRLTRTARHDEGETLGSGPPSGLVLEYVGAAPDNRAQLGRNRIVFRIRGGPGRPTALRADLKRSFTPAEGSKRRIDEPRGGDRLVHCAEFDETAVG